ncbi:hypothetical protein EKK97_13880 [Billgrantia tianxiuensis]|uniref:Sel1 repeat family protein n=1 Tax=Billgrantia tianxiuensis TaxID=2497861 RepID=A0A6I6SPN7_9GAMM|nr:MULTISPECIES: hypothetical protein [Halomonas]MCE8034587.1 hypothetical protein [Halomonas sp. MCCC 1A11057]QHC50454.1 hypothetical protein EKK97_13880 [Halomonas tianxiuensis]
MIRLAAVAASSLLTVLPPDAVAGDWLAHAREGYIEQAVELNSYSGFCENVAQAGFTAALNARRGIPYHQSLARAHDGQSYDHPLIDESTFIEHAVNFAYQDGGSHDLVSAILGQQCRRGESVFAEALHAYQHGLTAPDPTPEEVLEFACQRGYGPKAYLLHHSMYEVGLGVPQIMERSISTSPVMTRQMQRDLVEHLASERSASAEAARESVTADCMAERGIFTRR